MFIYIYICICIKWFIQYDLYVFFFTLFGPAGRSIALDRGPVGA